MRIDRNNYLERNEYGLSSKNKLIRVSTTIDQPSTSKTSNDLHKNDNSCNKNTYKQNWKTLGFLKKSSSSQKDHSNLDKNFE